MVRRTVLGTAFVVLALAGACDPGNPSVPDAAVVSWDASSTGPDATTTSDAGPSDAGVAPGEVTLGPSERPARLVVPPAHDGTTALPLVVLLHGYGASSVLQDAFFGMSRVARLRGFYLLLPDGTTDPGGNRFWNSGGPCCDFGGAGVDDVGYLAGLLDAAEATVPVDTSRVYFVGHSNGAFMSYRMACDLADRITGVAALAGTEGTMVACSPSRPVSVLHMHGTADATIAYSGGTIMGSAYLAAEDAVLAWLMRDGCDRTPVDGGRADFDGTIPGEESVVTSYPTCEGGAAVELWTMEGSGHIPPLTRGTTERIVDWLFSRTRS
ncbi:MAG: PHB depolymerase family esterase [Sandaracinaceae bacterium]